MKSRIPLMPMPPKPVREELERLNKRIKKLEIDVANLKEAAEKR